MNTINDIIAFFHRDTKVLLLVILAAISLCLTTGESINLVSVLIVYLRFFGIYYLLFFIVSRFYLAWAYRWKPDSRIGHRILGALGGNPDLEKARQTDWEFARGSLLFFLAISVYTNVKVRIPLINDRLYDEVVAGLDRTLFFTDFVSFGQFVVASPVIDGFLTRTYLHDYIFMALLAFLLFLRQDHYRLRLLFVSASLTYLLGVFITVAFPTLGPWLAFEENWSWMSDHPIYRIQQGLAQGWTAAREGSLDAQAFGGIAALPSLHVGHMALMFFVAWPCRSLLLYSVIMLEMTVFTTLATLAYGWHYLLDAPAGIALAFGCVKLTERLIHVDVVAGRHL